MGQASKRSPTLSTSGRLGLKRTGPYKGKAPMKNGACNQRERERKKRKKEKKHLVLDNLSKYKNTSSSDTIEESFP